MAQGLESSSYEDRHHQGLNSQDGTGHKQLHAQQAHSPGISNCDEISTEDIIVCKEHDDLFVTSWQSHFRAVICQT